jgi:threonylcarbamoyladenosine tRNA methylthiotransferase MtaB
MQRKVALFTVGCKLNQYETEALGEGLENAGFKRVDFSAEPADIYIVNTCTVTSQSDYSSRQAIYRAHKKSPTAEIIIVGCYVDLEPDFLKKLPGVKFVFANQKKDELVNFLTSRFFQKELPLNSPAEKPFRYKVSGHSKHTRGLVKIQDGCNESCAYCVVPLVRGREKSRNAEEIIQEVKELVKNNFKEVVLTGVHIGKYCHLGLNLKELAQKILEQTEVKRIRFSSIEPREFSSELLDWIKENPRICRHLHIPLQSGDDHILEKMNRNYSSSEYAEILKKIKEQLPEATIGADVIVGFPGEKESNFQNSFDFVESSPIDYLHVFSYSERKNTLAQTFPDKVSPREIKKRSQLMHDLGKRKWEKQLDSFLKKSLEILVEQRRDKKTGHLLTGLADNYIRVNFEGEDVLMNQLVTVKIVKREGKNLIGTHVG